VESVDVVVPAFPLSLAYVSSPNTYNSTPIPPLPAKKEEKREAYQ
jgi:hypothetical protein